MGLPRLPRESRAQEIGRLGEIAVSERFTRNGWLIVGNAQGTDFGVDLAAFKRSVGRDILPYALSIQVKAVERAQIRGAAAIARTRASTLASWLWSNTPTICVLYEVATDRLWWSPPAAAVSQRRSRDAKSRTLRLERRLDSPSDWESLTGAVAEQWSHHQGVGALLDAPLALQVLASVALETDLWTNAGEHSDAVYHAAAVHVYRTVCSLNALTGRLGSEAFTGLRTPTDEQVGLSWSLSLVSRNATTLGVVSGVELQPQSLYLMDVLGCCGAELAAAIPRLQQLAQMPELGVPADAVTLLSRITPLQLAIIDPIRAAGLEPNDFPQIADRDIRAFPATPEFDNQVLRPMGRPTAELPTALRHDKAPFGREPHW